MKFSILEEKMKIQIILEKKPEPIRFDQAKAIEISNKIGLRIIGTSYQEVFPLEKIKALMVVDNENRYN